MVEDTGTTEIFGSGKTVRVAEAVFVQPFAPVAVTV